MHRRSPLLFGILLEACGGDRPRSTSVPAPSPSPSVTRPTQDLLTGVVEAPDGSVAPDAFLAFNRVNGKRLALVRADGRGRFALPRPGEPFAITVTSAQGTALFVKPRDPAGSSGELRLRLGGVQGATLITGTLSINGRAPSAGELVSVTRLSDDEGDVFFGEVSANGSFAFSLTPGTYTLRPDSDELVAKAVNVTGEAGKRVEVALEASARSPAPEELVDWLRAKSIPISTVEVGTADQDIAALLAPLGKVRVLGIGEATHGTRDFTLLKHRILKRLAMDGPVILAMEANFAEAEHVDEYIRTGRGTPEQAAQRLFRVWQTEEVRDLLARMRMWNADAKNPHKIRFRGYDVQGARESLAALRTYFKLVDPAAVSLVEALAPLDRPTNTRGMIELDDAQKQETKAAAERLDAHMTAHRKAHVARSSVAAFDRATQHARVVGQAQALFAASTDQARFTARDRAMADNAAWLVEKAKPEERILVWAHNGHVQLDSSGLPGPNMGGRLRERLGGDYMSVGFVLDEGKYRASRDLTDPFTTVEVPLAVASPGDMAEAFTRVGVPIFAVDLRSTPSGIVSNWLKAPHLLRSCGWVVSESDRTGYPSSLAQLFDMAIFVHETTPSRPLR
jgi:erythromycin esterase